MPAREAVELLRARVDCSKRYGGAELAEKIEALTRCHERVARLYTLLHLKITIK
jgi:hypothetical protein